MCEKTFWFEIENDYRSGRNIYVEQQDTSDHACEISFQLPPENHWRIFIVKEFDSYMPVWHKDIPKEEDYMPVYHKIFAQFHYCLPFVVKNITFAYKEEGEYPVVPHHINEMPDVLPESLKKDIDEDYDGFYFIFVLDSHGTPMLTKMLTPL